MCPAAKLLTIYNPPTKDNILHGFFLFKDALTKKLSTRYEKTVVHLSPFASFVISDL